MTDNGLSPVVHALSVDVEGFAESHAQSVRVDPGLMESSVSDAEIEANLTTTVELFAEHGCTATFFFLGRIAQTSPQLVKMVADAGHEIGCHSLHHLRITGQSQTKFREDLRAARSALENASGQAVVGFRAPDFSIGAQNLWAFDELWEAGFRYDSSAVPTDIHDVYGMADVSEDIFRWPNGLIEFPLPVTRFLGKSIPVGGGGYFRLFPLWLTRHGFRQSARAGRPAMFYIHPYEIGSVAPRLAGLTLTRRFRHYVRLEKGRQRMGKLLRTIKFTRVVDVLRERGFDPMK
jgi:polysaccharide deacetylase family protein (PEP-CTERM system associated)